MAMTLEGGGGGGLPLSGCVYCKNIAVNLENLRADTQYRDSSLWGAGLCFKHPLRDPENEREK